MRRAGIAHRRLLALVVKTHKERAFSELSCNELAGVRSVPSSDCLPTWNPRRHTTATAVAPDARPKRRRTRASVECIDPVPARPVTPTRLGGLTPAAIE